MFLSLMLKPPTDLTHVRFKTVYAQNNIKSYTCVGVYVFTLISAVVAVS